MHQSWANPPQISLIIREEDLKLVDFVRLPGLATRLQSSMSIKVVIDYLHPCKEAQLFASPSDGGPPESQSCGPPRLFRCLFFNLFPQLQPLICLCGASFSLQRRHSCRRPDVETCATNTMAPQMITCQIRCASRLPAALGTGCHIDMTWLAILRAHNQQRQSIESLAIVSLERLHRGRIAVVYAGNGRRTIQLEIHLVVR